MDLTEQEKRFAITVFIDYVRIFGNDVPSMTVENMEDDMIRILTTWFTVKAGSGAPTTNP